MPKQAEGEGRALVNSLPAESKARSFDHPALLNHTLSAAMLTLIWEVPKYAMSPVERIHVTLGLPIEDCRELVRRIADIIS